FASGGRLVAEARSLLARWEQMERDRRQLEESNSELSAPDGSESIDDRLMEVLRALRDIADEIQEISRAISSMTEELPASLHFALRRKHDDMAALAQRLEAALHDVPMAFEADAVETDEWSETIDVDAGPWALQFTGTARPSPQLAVTLTANEIVGEQP